jgi:RpiR family carbohydrate utilization transcriptional regulator
MTHEALSERSAGHNILEIVHESIPQLRRSERKVADRILTDPHRILNATLAETSALSDVSEPTVIRFCVAIGCSGYQEFKLRLAHSLALGTTATHSVLSKSDTTETLTDKIFGYTMTSLDWTKGHLDNAALERAVKLLGVARYIEFFGLGASSVVAMDAQQKFPLFGVPCGAHTDTLQQLATASMMNGDGVAVIFSQNGYSAMMIEIAKAAKANGAQVIGVLGLQSTLVEHCDVAISVDTLDNADFYTPTISRIAAMVIVDILSSAVGLKRDDAQVQRFEHLQNMMHNENLPLPDKA